jgi:hypothetical protein
VRIDRCRSLSGLGPGRERCGIDVVGHCLGESVSEQHPVHCGDLGVLSADDLLVEWVAADADTGEVIDHLPVNRRPEGP